MYSGVSCSHPWFPVLKEGPPRLLLLARFHLVAHPVGVSGRLLRFQPECGWNRIYPLPDLYRLKISLSLSEDKFVAISPTQGKRLCLRQKFVLGSREEVLRERLLVGGNGHGKS